MTASKTDDRFPRSAKYDHTWMIENSMGPNAVWLVEYLSEAMDLKPGMKVLDLGCGKAMTSIFLAREFDVEVWASDLWIPADENRTRIEAAGLSDRIHAVHAEAHDLPYERNFFDAIASIDAYHYFGTDDLYLGYILQFLGKEGLIGIVSPGLKHDFDGDPPEHLHAGWHWDFASFHSPEWWRRHWERTGKVDVTTADWLEEGWQDWVFWNRALSEERGLDAEGETEMVKEDAGRNLGFARIVAQPRIPARWR